MFGSSRRVGVAAVAHVAGIEIIIALVVRRIAGVVTEEAAPARIVRRRRSIAAADVADTGVAGEIAAAVIATAIPRRCGGVRHAARMIVIARETVVAAHHGADAVEQHGPADDARHRRGSGAEKRAAAASRWGGANRISALLLWRSLWISLWSPLGLTGARPRAPCAARTHSTGPHGRNGGAWLVASHDCVAHAVEKAATALGRCRDGAFELLNSPVGALEGFVLHQHRLHQRVNRIWRAAEAFANQPFGIGVTTLAFQLGEAFEQIRNELLFLRGHGCPPQSG